MAASQANALAAIADLKTIVQAFNNLHWLCKQFAERQTEDDYVSTWNAQATYAVNADGSQGATDSVPNTAHPIVGQGVSAGALSTAVGYLCNDFVSFVENGTPSQADRRPAIDALLP